MKRTDLEKLKGKKLAATGGAPDRFGRDAAAPGDRRAQRERDRAEGLVPFAVKLHGDLVKSLHDAAEKDGTSLNELVEDLLKRGLASKG